MSVYNVYKVCAKGYVRVEVAGVGEMGGGRGKGGGGRGRGGGVRGNRKFRKQAERLQTWTARSDAVASRLVAPECTRAR